MFFISNNIVSETVNLLLPSCVRMPVNFDVYISVALLLHVTLHFAQTRRRNFMTILPIFPFDEMYNLEKNTLISKLYRCCNDISVNGVDEFTKAVVSRPASIFQEYTSSARGNPNDRKGAESDCTHTLPIVCVCIHSI